MSDPSLKQQLDILVLGAGSWGTVFASMLASSGANVRLWARSAAVVAEINSQHTNLKYLPDFAIHHQVEAVKEIDFAKPLDGIVLAVPAQTLRQNFKSWPAFPKVPVLSLIKGIEKNTDHRVSQIMAEVGIDQDLIAVLSGPNLAKEIAAKQPSASVIAATNLQTAHQVASWCRVNWFRTYVSEDVVGVEIAGALKNVIAVAVGIAAGLGYGDNSRASLITRGLAEITRFGIAHGASASTFAGLAGMGDLVATCSSELSRNFRVGKLLGEGVDIAQALAQVGQTAEGIQTARAVNHIVKELNARGVDLEVPIASFLVDVIDHKRPISDVAKELLSRSVRPE